MATKPSKMAYTPNMTINVSKVMPGQINAAIPNKIASTPRRTTSHQF
jgi:hypothetical protein